MREIPTVNRNCALHANPHPNPSPHRAFGRTPVSRRAIGEGNPLPPQCKERGSAKIGGRLRPRPVLGKAWQVRKPKLATPASIIAQVDGSGASVVVTLSRRSSGYSSDHRAGNTDVVKMSKKSPALH
jgi:hypothetical protein